MKEEFYPEKDQSALYIETNIEKRDQSVLYDELNTEKKDQSALYETHQCNSIERKQSIPQFKGFKFEVHGSSSFKQGNRDEHKYNNNAHIHVSHSNGTEGIFNFEGEILKNTGNNKFRSNRLKELKNKIKYNKSKFIKDWNNMNPNKKV